MADTVEASKKPDTKMIPETDLIALREGSRSRERKLKEQLEEANRRVEDLAAREKVARLSGDDDDAIKAVKKYLLEQEDEINKARARYEKDVTSYQERERGVRAKELAVEYKQRGVDVSVESLLNSEDMEKVALDRYAEFLAEENKKLKETPKPPEPRVFESTPAGTSKKQVKDMSDEEFAEFEKTIKSQKGY